MQRVDGILGMLLGSRETIKRGIVGGLVSAIVFGILTVVWCFVNMNPLGPNATRSLAESFSDFGARFWLWYLLFMAAVLLLASVGLSVGWMFSRPVVSLLEVLWPGNDGMLFIWIASNTIAWAIIAPPVVLSIAYWNDFLGSQNQVAAVIVSVASGIVGGFAAGRASTAITGKETAAVGATVSAGVLALLHAALRLIAGTYNADMSGAREALVDLAVAGALLTLAGMFVYSVIRPIVGQASKLMFFRERVALVWIVASCVVCELAGLVYLALFAGSNSLLEMVVSISAVGLSGICGGWAAAQFVRDEAIPLD